MDIKNDIFNRKIKKDPKKIGMKGLVSLKFDLDDLSLDVEMPLAEEKKEVKVKVTDISKNPKGKSKGKKLF